MRRRSVEDRMRFRLGMTMVLAALGAASVGACSFSSPPTPAPEPDGGNHCASSLNDLLSATPGPACPIGPNGPSSYDEAITTTCDALKQTKGDIQYGQCFEYLVWQVDLDASGKNLSKCFYDIKSHALVGVIYGDGTSTQCGGQVDTTCTVTGFNGGGGSFQSCAPVSDAGGGGG
jgi:hypothetical protein